MLGEITFKQTKYKSEMVPYDVDLVFEDDIVLKLIPEYMESIAEDIDNERYNYCKIKGLLYEDVDDNGEPDDIDIEELLLKDIKPGENEAEKINKEWKKIIKKTKQIRILLNFDGEDDNFNTTISEMYGELVDDVLNDISIDRFVIYKFESYDDDLNLFDVRKINPNVEFVFNSEG